MFGKKIISSVTALGILMSMLTAAPIANADSAVMTKEVYTNVAQFKEITSAVQDNATYPKAHLVDGKENSLCTTGTGDYIIDLGHRYSVNKIEITKGWCTSGGKISVANKADGSDRLELGGIGNYELDGTKAYRYVILTTAGYSEVKEIKVYSNQIVTEVSRNKPTATNNYHVDGIYQLTSDKAVNGTNKDAYDCWKTYSTSQYNYLEVDLEAPMNIGYIEMEGRTYDEAGDRYNIGIYGSKASSQINGESYTTTSIITDKNIASRLAHISYTGDYTTFPYPAYNAESPETTTYKASVNDTEAYQYIVYKKEREKSAASIGEFRAYVVNPQVTETIVNGKNVTVLFSDNMDSEILKESVALRERTTGDAVELKNLVIDGYTMTFTLPYAEDFDLEIKKEAKNTYGVAFAGDEVISVNAAEDRPQKEIYTNIAQNKKITSTAADNTTYPNANLLDSNTSTLTVVASGDYIIDLGHRYNIELIDSTGGWFQGGSIYLANNADYSDKIKVGGVVSNKIEDITLNGTKAYRYVIFSSSGYGEYYEMMVYAKQTVTEIATGKSVTASGYTSADGYDMIPEKAVNGTNNWGYDCWNHNIASIYPYLAVNLDKPEHIGYIEIESRNVNPYGYAPDRESIAVYGANTLTDENKEAYTTTAKITDTSIATRLLGVSSIPEYLAADPENTTFKATVNDTEAYQYIVYKKEAYKPASVGEFRAYVVNPTVTDANYDKNKVTIAFSDEMNAQTLVKSAVIVTDIKTNETVEISNFALDGYTLTFDVPYNSNYTVSFADAVRNEYGVKLAKNTTVNLEGLNDYNELQSYTRNYNVAVGKPVEVSGLACGTEANIADDDRETYVDCAEDVEGGYWIQFDLLRRYKIDSVKLSGRRDDTSKYTVSNLKLLVSNDETFTEYDVLDELVAGTQTADAFDELKGSNKAYRYVRLYSESAISGVSEVQIWADQTVTNVSRGKSVIVGNTESGTAENLVDGISALSDNSNVWYGSKGTTEAYDYVRIDLGAKYYVGAIELEAGTIDDFVHRTNFNVYGHNNDDIGTLSEEELAAYRSKTADDYTEANGYNLLAGVGNIARIGYMPMPAFDAEADETFYKGAVNDDAAYRYITYKRTSPSETALGEIRVMVINPVINDIVTEDNKVTVEFSDIIDEYSVLEGGISVTDAQGTSYEVSNVTVDGYNISFDVANVPENDALTVNVSKSIRNDKGITMAEDYIGKTVFGKGIIVNGLKLDKDALTAKDTITASANITSVIDESVPVSLFIAVKKDDGEMLSINLHQEILVSNGSVDLSASVTLPEDVDGVTVEAYVWNGNTLEPYCDMIWL